MKLTSTMMTMALAAGRALYGEVAPALERSVTVCMDSVSGLGSALQARAIASKMFGAIGVAINWHVGLAACPSQSIQISLSQNTPKSQRPGAYAYALPYEGTHIVVYYDRISECYQKPLVTILLAHVLVHEITHILEGISRHSISGIMKARWDNTDLGTWLGSP